MNKISFSAFLILLLISKQIKAQNTITFDDQSYTEGQKLGSSFSLINNEISFDFNVSGLTDSQYFSYSDISPNSKEKIEGGLFFNNDENSGYTANLITIKTSKGEKIDFESIKIVNDDAAYFHSDSSLKMEGFRDGLSTGFVIIEFNHPLNSNGTGVRIVDVSNNSSFDKVDEVRITDVTGGRIIILGIMDNIVWNKLDDSTLGNSSSIRNINNNFISTKNKVVSFHNVNTKESEISIYTISGKNVINSIKTLNDQLDLSSLKTGIYILNIKLKNGEIITEKIML